jgi:hypothetical protein
MSLAEKGRLTVEVRSRLQADLEPHTRVFLERALEAIPEMTDLALETLAAELAKPPDRLERELRNLHRNIHRETSGTG